MLKLHAFWQIYTPSVTDRYFYSVNGYDMPGQFHSSTTNHTLNTKYHPGYSQYTHPKKHSVIFEIYRGFPAKERFHIP